MSPMLATVVYACVGVTILVGAFIIIDLLTPGKLWQEILEKQNRALATLGAGFAIAVAIIVASAIH
jgi:putative membrane protein